jgi:hypothetical protein
MSAAVLAVTLWSLCAAPLSAQTPKTAPANRLINSANPYLLQHARNPVDWYAWGDAPLVSHGASW